jgi:hypothetical protein
MLLQPASTKWLTNCRLCWFGAPAAFDPGLKDLSVAARLQVLEGSLLQQLHEQADRMTSSYEEVSAAIAMAPEAPAAAT